MPKKYYHDENSTAGSLKSLNFWWILWWSVTGSHIFWQQTKEAWAYGAPYALGSVVCFPVWGWFCRLEITGKSSLPNLLIFQCLAVTPQKQILLQWFLAVISRQLKVPWRLKHISMIHPHVQCFVETGMYIETYRTMIPKTPSISIHINHTCYHGTCIAGSLGRSSKSWGSQKDQIYTCSLVVWKGEGFWEACLVRLQGPPTY